MSSASTLSWSRSSVSGDARHRDGVAALHGRHPEIPAHAALAGELLLAAPGEDRVAVDEQRAQPGGKDAGPDEARTDELRRIGTKAARAGRGVEFVALGEEDLQADRVERFEHVLRPGPFAKPADGFGAGVIRQMGQLFAVMVADAREQQDFGGDLLRGQTRGHHNRECEDRARRIHPAFIITRSSCYLRPRTRSMARRSRLEGRPVRKPSIGGADLRSSAALRRASRLSSVSR